LSDLETDREASKILRDTMITVFPQLAQARIEYVWGGTVGFTLDKVPHAGNLDGVYYATGYCGHGVQMASYMGKCMADVIDGNPDANPWRDIDFPSVPYAFGWEWILPLAGFYFRMKDRIW
jgi:glycine/D-amino acid oxidase-like deaminating enzyme